MNLETILTFITNDKTIIVGAVVAITEIITIIVNFYRKIKAEAEAVKILSTSKTSFINKFFWSANPANLFRKP